MSVFDLIAAESKARAFAYPLIRVGTTCREMTPEQIRIRYESKFSNRNILLTNWLQRDPGNTELLAHLQVRDSK